MTPNAPDLEELLRRPAWMARAACAGEPLTTFFGGKGQSAAPAKGVCAGCPVRRECLDHALSDPTLDGVWGGTTERERRTLRARRAAGRASADPEHLAEQSVAADSVEALVLLF